MMHVAAPHGRESLLQDFVDWTGQHIKGDEKGEARIFPVHQNRDDIVLAAYGFSAKKDLLAQRLEPNQSVTAKEKVAETVIAPGVPPSYGDAEKLITDDCIRP